MGTGDSLASNPFAILGVTQRDDRDAIIRAAELSSSGASAEQLQQAKATLLHPRLRLAAEVAWFPGLSNDDIEDYKNTCQRGSAFDLWLNPFGCDLALCNLLADVLESDCTEWTAKEAFDIIHRFALCVGRITPEQVMKEINEDRTIARLWLLKDLLLLDSSIRERRLYYKRVVNAFLNRLAVNDIVVVATLISESICTSKGSVGNGILEDVLGAYELEAGQFLTKESDSIMVLLKLIGEAAKNNKAAFPNLVKRLGDMTRQWDRVAQPLQLLCEYRGLEHELSKGVAFAIRNLAVDLFNRGSDENAARPILMLVKELFCEHKSIEAIVEGDLANLDIAVRSAAEAKLRKSQEDRENTFSATLGWFPRQELFISSDWLRWGDVSYRTEDVTRVRWGGLIGKGNVLKSGKAFVIAFGTRSSYQVVKCTDETVYAEYTRRLFRVVAFRLLIEVVAQVQEIGNATICGIHLTDKGLTVNAGSVGRTMIWSHCSSWSANGLFCVGVKGQQSALLKLSFMDDWNVHVVSALLNWVEKTPGLVSLGDLLPDHEE